MKAKISLIVLFGLLALHARADEGLPFGRQGGMFGAAPARVAQLTPEERQALRERWLNMPPEQRALLRERFMRRLRSMSPEERQRLRQEWMRRGAMMPPAGGMRGNMWREDANQDDGYGFGYERRGFQRHSR